MSKIWWTCSSHLSKLVLSFLGMGSSTEMAFYAHKPTFYCL
jgi:hypothetical protein